MCVICIASVSDASWHHNDIGHFIRALTSEVQMSCDIDVSSQGHLKRTSWECSFGYQVYRRSRALKDVPGPECNSVLGLLHLLGKRDMHRVCTEHAEKYGPIFKWRLFTFHVGSPF